MLQSITHHSYMSTYVLYLYRILSYIKFLILKFYRIELYESVIKKHMPPHIHDPTTLNWMRNLAWTWDDLAMFRRRITLPLVVKGILTGWYLAIIVFAHAVLSEGIAYWWINMYNIKCLSVHVCSRPLPERLPTNFNTRLCTSPKLKISKLIPIRICFGFDDVISGFCLLL